MIENTQEIRDFVWLHLKPTLLGRGIQLDDLRRVSKDEFKHLYFEAWDAYILGMGLI